MDLESFAVTHSEMYDALMDIVNDTYITNEQIIDFCQTLTDYLTYDVLCLKTPPPYIDQALDFCKIYGKGTANITELKNKLGKIYEPMVQRLEAERLYLDQKLPLEQRSAKTTSRTNS